MARTIVVIDDLDGSPDAEEVVFSWDGVTWSIDLSEANKAKLHEALRPYLDKAHPAQLAQATQPEPARRTRRPRGEASTGEKLDYTAEENFGIVHQGRVKPEEAAMVRDNIEQANANRARHGQAPIDPNDDKDKKRYGF